MECGEQLGLPTRSYNKDVSLRHCDDGSKGTDSGWQNGGDDGDRVDVML